MTPLAQAISGALVQFVWQGFLVSLLVSVAMFLLRRQRPDVLLRQGTSQPSHEGDRP